jgi:hypothetical protein
MLVEAIIFDNAAEDVTIRLNSLAANASSTGHIATLTSSGASGAIQTLSFTPNPSFPVIVNNSNSYFVDARWNTPASPSGIRLHSVRITYTVTAPLP